jgi:hypothetical protein
MGIGEVCLGLAALLVIETVVVAWINRNKPNCEQEKEAENIDVRN